MPELPPTRDYPPDRGFPDTPPPGYDGEWPPRKPAPIPAPEMPEPDYPPTGPPGYTGEWPPPHRPLHDLIRILETYDLGSIIHDPTEAQYGYESGSYMSGDITSEN